MAISLALAAARQPTVAAPLFRGTLSQRYSLLSLRGTPLPHRSDSKPSRVTCELLMQITKIADDTQIAFQSKEKGVYCRQLLPPADHLPT